MHLLILYGSLTGNTLLVSEHMHAFLTKRGHAVDLVDQSFCEFETLNAYDFVLIGASTWGEGDPNPATQVFIEQLDALERIEMKRVALFGLGDSAYEHFCGVVDKLESSLARKQIVLCAPSLRLDGFPDEVMCDKVDAWLDRDILPQLYTIAELPLADSSTSDA
ncbi:MAG: flavodoxin family protein [bacterium]